ncbi:hypothetical protein P775_14245 [Puniceibacterium antarcticum]|uniref:DUF3168 domain-containing protein n=1 Tax=Puniceibacterium antarcticum TaxID=1206336 RepID=A0A2G8RDA0_9RHOB|nr:DUF3168 domain-containing protein [Puniceibacterium antarcticum]PIL19510.1 hypothetical protein P775_14245 [Puniceibacterium antarcticum]
MELELRALLLGSAAITDLCADRINWGVHPQGAEYPALVLNVIGDMPGATLAGSDGLFVGRIQIDAYGNTYGAAAMLGHVVRDLLHGYAGGHFRGVWLDAGPRSGRESGEINAARPFRSSLDFLTNWRV